MKSDIVPSMPQRCVDVLNLMLAGKTLRSTEQRDRRACAHIVSVLRTEHYVPIETVELTPVPNKVIGYRMTEGERAAYYDDREAQRNRVRDALLHAKAVRLARATVEFFAERGKQDDIPDWCAALAKPNEEREEIA